MSEDHNNNLNSAMPLRKEKTSAEIRKVSPSDLQPQTFGSRILDQDPGGVLVRSSRAELFKDPFRCTR